MYEHDERIVMTLDAGGTNFVFSAIKGCVSVVEPVCLPAVPDNLEGCLSALVDGFTKVKESLVEEPVAISFAFPGPADYKHGIIGDLPNFPAFRGGVALGSFWKISSVFRSLSITMATCLHTARRWRACFRKSTASLKRLGIPNVIRICWESLWAPVLAREW